MKSYYLITFYRFVKIKNIKKVKNKLDTYLKNKNIRGTILISNEGINGSLSGNINDVENTLKLIKINLKIRKLKSNANNVNFLPFNRMKVRLKKEIVSLGLNDINIKKINNNHVDADQWDKLISDKNTKLIDIRNKYEIEIGKFRGSINPQTNSFRDLPKRIKNMNIKKNQNIAIYCTGGIRCEKASILLKQNGYKNIFQLDGGILKYLENKKKSKKRSLWDGECFVFDNRITVNNNLQVGKYTQCYGCRHPLLYSETKLKSYIKGVSCIYCYNKRSESQKFNSSVRQSQINNAESKRIDHPFKKISILE